MSEKCKRMNEQWVKKQKELGKDYKGFNWGFTIAGALMLLLLIFALVEAMR